MFPSIAAGRHRLITFDQADLLEGSVLVSLAENQRIDVSILIAGGFGTVKGVVLDANGSPVADAVVGGGMSLVNVNPVDDGCVGVPESSPALDRVSPGGSVPLASEKP